MRKWGFSLVLLLLAVAASTLWLLSKVAGESAWHRRQWTGVSSALTQHCDVAFEQPLRGSDEMMQLDSSGSVCLASSSSAATQCCPDAQESLQIPPDECTGDSCCASYFWCTAACIKVFGQLNMHISSWFQLWPGRVAAGPVWEPPGGGILALCGARCTVSPAALQHHSRFGNRRAFCFESKF